MKIHTSVPPRSVKMTLANIRRAERVCKKIINLYNWFVLYIDMQKSWGKKEKWTNGGVNYKYKLIYLRHSMNERKALLVFLHEMGHVFAGLRGFAKATTWRPVDYSKRHFEHEKRAYLYGWGLIQCLGLRVTKKEWRNINWQIFMPKMKQFRQRRPLGYMALQSRRRRMRRNRRCRSRAVRNRSARTFKNT